ncbi:MAG: ABC transporter substrate-binding protein [Oribacterium sp.]|uniref:ABC transporter substrate-binding protein n=1 Tax=Oribacterium sp. Sow4_G1_1 TaxID=3438794 RepID=UPI002A7A340B|nr:ABC transporter substrate-binding protein [Oribacterium sp.]MDD6520020.1 ABC transporter substrate-binding protein [Oribacterium sp.]MDY2855155.1 ABC transporter substrate-binding protein [Oliverpabstia sp.]
MRKTLSLVLAAAMLSTTIAACGSSNNTATTTAAAAETTAAAETSAAETTAAAGETADASAAQDFAGQTLTISTFSFNAELLQKNIYDPFMEQTGAKLVVETGKNAERVTKIEESPENYDVVVISDSFAAQLGNDGILGNIDRSKIANLDSIYDAAKAPMGEEYGPAYTFNRLGIVYDPSMIDVEIKSFADLWNPELKDCIAVPDITTTSGVLFYYATAAAFGLTPGQDDDAIFAKLEELKPNVVKTWTSANDTITMLNQGEASVAALLDYSYTTAKQANPDYVWVSPSEGNFACFNMLNITKDCKNKELAEAFINFYLSKDVQLADALDGVDAPVNTEVELTEEQAANFTYGQEMVDSLVLPDWSLITEKKADWINRWNELFSVQ